MSWKHYNPVAIHSGVGSTSRLGAYTSGRNILLVTSGGMLRRGTADRVMQKGEPARLQTHVAEPNPDLDRLDADADALRQTVPDCIVALGGGSAMDSAKALSLALRSPVDGALSRWLRGNEPVTFHGDLPLICIPTTAGTGAEVTPFATIWDTAQRKKRSLSHRAVYPQAAMLDPSLTLGLPWPQTLYGALDAISHALETLWNGHATPLSLALARQALDYALTAFPRVAESPEDLAAREGLQTAALFAGLAISQSKSAIAHSISYPLTLRFGMPHGLACAFTLSAIAALMEEEESWRCEEDRDLARRVADVLRQYNVASLASEYCSRDDALSLVAQMHTPDRADNFMLPLSVPLLERILAESLHSRP